MTSTQTKHYYLSISTPSGLRKESCSNFDGILSVLIARSDAWVAGSAGDYASHIFPTLALAYTVVLGRAKTRRCIAMYGCGWSLQKELLRGLRTRTDPGL
jgi:hypothetical protein